MNTQETITWAQIAAIVVPAGTTIIVGWWINRKNEEYKTELARESARRQKRDAWIFDEQALSINEIFGSIVDGYTNGIELLNYIPALKHEGEKETSRQMLAESEALRSAIGRVTALKAPILDAEFKKAVGDFDDALGRIEYLVVKYKQGDIEQNQSREIIRVHHKNLHSSFICINSLIRQKLFEGA